MADLTNYKDVKKNEEIIPRSECPSIIEESLNTKELFVALLEAQKLVQPPSKDSTAKVSGQSKKTGKPVEYTYKFTAGESMWAAGRQAFLSADLLWSNCGWEIRTEGNVTYFDGYFELVHPKSGQFRIYKFPMAIVGSNNPDKDIAGAQTYLGAKATRGVLMIPQEEENQPDKRTREPAPSQAPRETQRTVRPANGNRKPAEPKGGDDASQGDRKTIQAWWRRLQKVNAEIGGGDLGWNAWCCEVMKEKGLPEPENRTINIPTVDQGQALLSWLKEEVPKLEAMAKEQPRVVPDTADVGTYPDEEPPEGEGYQADAETT